MSNNGKRFAHLFRGYTERFGRYDITGEVAPEKKVDGNARTVDAPLTLKEYLGHVEGKVGIGVIPLQGAPKAPGIINFAAIDIDVYSQEDQTKRNLTHSDVAITLMETPLIVSRSKSGGIHVWLFSEQGVSAQLAIDYLNAQAAHLGVGGCEVFPKQTARHSDEDVGNWINLPYFGDSRHAVIPSKNGSVIELVDLELSKFLDIAEAASKVVSDEWLRENTVLPTSQRSNDTEEELFYDGPPCLQRLLIGDPRKIAKLEQEFNRKKRGALFDSEAAEERAEAWLAKQKATLAPQNLENNRNNAFFGVAMYLHRRLSPHDPDAPLDEDAGKKFDVLLDDIHSDWRFATGNSGITSELSTLKKQGRQGKWGYTCTKEPLKSFCDRRLCFKRKFGIGTGAKDSPFAITGFTIVTSEERQYYLTVGNKRIHVPDAQSLFSQSIFAQHVLNQTDRMWRMLQDAKYKELMDSLLESADKIAPPPDSDSVAIIRNALYDFIHDMRQPKGTQDLAFFQGRVLISEDERTGLFKLDQFEAFLRARGYTHFTTKMIAKKLVDDLGVVGRGNTQIAGRQVRPYAVDLSHLDLLMEGETDGKD